MALTSISVILTVCILKLHHSSPNQKEVPAWLRTFIFGGLNRLVRCKCRTQKPRRSRRRENGKFSAKLSTDNTEACLRLVNEPHKRRHSPVGEFCNSHSHNQNYKDNIRMNDLGSMGNSNSNSTGTGTDPSGLHQDIKRLSVMEEILHYLKLIVTKRDLDDEDNEVVNEWRAVAVVCDRFLFWMFLTMTLMITLFLIVVIPVIKYSVYDDSTITWGLQVLKMVTYVFWIILKPEELSWCQLCYHWR